MIGAIVVATDQGLGYLAKDFYDNGVIDKVLIHKHSSRKTHHEWYGEDGRMYSRDNVDWFFKGLDTVLYFEEAFEWKLIPMARNRGIKNVFMPMYECTRQPFPYEPDVILCPSELDMEYFKDKDPILVTVPVDTQHAERTKAKVFVHNAGNGGLGGRNGTRELLEAMKYVKSPLELIIRAQEGRYKTSDKRITLESGTIPKEDLYKKGDVFIFPEKFNGLSLPLQEAYASGMLVMATDRFPINTWLPKQPLISVKGYKKETIAVEFDSAIIDPKDIAKIMDKWYNKDISEYSEMGRRWGLKNNWKALKNDYLKIC